MHGSVRRIGAEQPKLDGGRLLTTLTLDRGSVGRGGSSVDGARLAGDQLLQLDPWYSEDPADPDDRQARSAVAHQPAAGLLVGQTAADPKDRSRLFHGQQDRQILKHQLESFPA
jgi:hypothetical protein